MLRYFHHVVALVITPLLLVGCSSPGNGPGGSTGAGQPGGGGARGAGVAVPVMTAHVEQKAVPVIVAAVGTVEAISSVQIRAQVTAQLVAIHFAEGQEVLKGQPLFSLDSRPFLAALQQADAILARDTATLQNAQAQQARAENLFQRGLIARDQFDTQRTSAASLAATVAADKAAVESARLNVQYTDINSPISGRTGTLGVHAGDLVRANDTIPLVVINQLAPVDVTFSIPGHYLADVRRYQARRPLPVTAFAAADANPIAPATVDEGSAARGVLSFIDNTVDSTTGTIRLKGTFPNSKRELWPGVFVRVTLQLTTDTSALLVPTAAVQVSQNGQYVYVVKPDGTVDMRTVKVGRQHGTQVVIANGLSAGEVVVTEGQLRLTPGARVSERGESGGSRGAGDGPGGTPATDIGGSPRTR